MPDVIVTTWNLDPAASRPRLRAFMGDGWELLSYVDGFWVVLYQGVGRANGQAATQEEGQVRALQALPHCRALLELRRP